MGFMLFLYAIPVLSLALVAWAVASRGLSSGLRRASMAAAIVLACATLTLIRTDGITGSADSDLEWRWTPTPEQRLLAGVRPRASRVPAARLPVQRPAYRAIRPYQPTASAPIAPESPISERRNRRRAASTLGRPGGRAKGRRLAGLSRAGPRRHRSGRADRNRLVAKAAGGSVASADRAGLVVLRCRRKSPLHAGAAR